MFEVYIGRLKFMAQALDKAGINNVLWGDAVKSLLIHPEIPKVGTTPVSLRRESDAKVLVYPPSPPSLVNATNRELITSFPMA